MTKLSGISYLGAVIMIVGCEPSYSGSSVQIDSQTCRDLLIGHQFQIDKIRQFQISDNRSYQEYEATESCRQSEPIEHVAAPEGISMTARQCPRHPVDTLKSMPSMLDLIDIHCSTESAANARSEFAELEKQFQ